MPLAASSTMIAEFDRGQRAVGVLAEILVARRVEQVEGAPPILEGHHRGGDRDPALLLDLHPVRARAPPLALGLDLARQMDGAAEQQELLGQRGLAGVGVRDDRQGAPPGGGLGDRGVGRSRVGAPATGSAADVGAPCRRAQERQSSSIACVQPAGPVGQLRADAGRVSTRSSAEQARPGTGLSRGTRRWPRRFIQRSEASRGDAAMPSLRDEPAVARRRAHRAPRRGCAHARAGRGGRIRGRGRSAARRRHLPPRRAAAARDRQRRRPPPPAGARCASKRRWSGWRPASTAIASPAARPIPEAPARARPRRGAVHGLCRAGVTAALRVCGFCPSRRIG